MTRQTSNPAKQAYDKARYQSVRKAKIASAQKWYQENLEVKKDYDLKRRPAKNAKRKLVPKKTP